MLASRVIGKYPSEIRGRIYMIFVRIFIMLITFLSYGFYFGLYQMGTFRDTGTFISLVIDVKYETNFFIKRKPKNLPPQNMCYFRRLEKNVEI